MRSILAFVLVMVCANFPISAVAAAAATTATADGPNPIYAYTHLLPSPLTLPGGKLILGTEVAYGVTDFLQIGTSVIGDIYQIYNAEAKVNIVSVDEFALALTGEWQSYNYNNIDSANPSVQVTAWQPGVVMGYSVLPNLAHFIGAKLSYANTTQNVEGAQLSGFVSGASAESDLAWAHGPGKHPLSLVLAGGVSYDFTYKIVGFGLSYYIGGFHFGLHYYPNADLYKVQPILAGGTSVNF